MTPRLFTVRSKRLALRDTATLALNPVEGSPLAFQPGQFNMLYVFGVGEVAISISGDPSDPAPLVHTIRSVGTVSRSLCSLKRGEPVGVRGPFGAGWPMNDAMGKNVLIVAGGIGLAPLRPVIYDIISNREAYGRVTVLAGARTPDDLLYADELRKWRARFDMDVSATVDSAKPGWRGHVGVVTTLIPRAGIDAQKTVAMICGPEIMMKFAVKALQEQGLPSERMYLSMERNMKCAVGLCGHCLYGSRFICKDGPVFRFDTIENWLAIREL